MFCGISLYICRMILVTGGTGLVGSHLLFDLAKNGEKVRALKRPTSDLSAVKKIFEYYSPNKNSFEQIEWMDGDVLDVVSLQEAMQGVEKVYHCAAYVSFNPKKADKLLKINIEGTANIVNTCLENKVKKLCHVSSTAAIGHTDNGELITEKVKWRQTKNTSNYSISKHHSEREVWRGIEEGLNAVIVNPCIVIGPGNWGKSSTSFFPQVWRGMKYYSTGGNAFVDARDVSKAMLNLMESNINSEHFLIVGENMSFRHFFDLIAENLGKPKPNVKAGSFITGLAWRAERVRNMLTGSRQLITRETAYSSQQASYYSNQKIKDAIGLEFVSIEQSIKETSAIFLKEKGATH